MNSFHMYGVWKFSPLVVDVGYTLTSHIRALYTSSSSSKDKKLFELSQLILYVKFNWKFK